MSSEVEVLLKYNRSQVGWSCPQCETENPVTVGRCILCGYTRDARARVLATGVVQDRIQETTTESQYSAPTNPVKRETNTAVIVTICVLLVAVAAVAVMLIQNM